ncbi:hypothetical protein MUN81_11100 [Hymenobacter sp. 5317J-9]|uniref:hypothetical protein n=1 Tax=Hymenobacter sp. 5317J-9 TaxID=2932250 RepID=UPI001FD6E34C|nr:hypothetical protein [Hymenobacter sp. 5317J-9]UOQ95812.1 hypothetical protein MUN81_11100 [Hymenobacter sp. 5317J-9]
MKWLFAFAFVAALAGGELTWHTRPARHLLVGQYYYDIALKTQYEHDDDAYGTYFMVTRANSQKAQCSSTRQRITRKKVLHTTGEYAIEGPYLRFKERSYGPRRIDKWLFPDSVVKTFSPNRTGQLQLTEVWEYTEGKMSRYRWVLSGTTAKKTPF